MFNRHLITRITAAVFILLCIGSSAQAEKTTYFGQTADGNWMTGLKVANVENNRAGFNDARAVGVVLGYEFARPVGVNGTSSIELEILNSFDEGSIEIGSDFGVPGEWKSDSFALFFTYRTPGTVYFKGKLGAMKTEVRSILPNVTEKDSDGGFAYGLGLGLRLGDHSTDDDLKYNIELEWTGSSGDNDVNLISLGGNVLF